MLRDEKIEHGPAPSRGSGVEAGARAEPRVISGLQTKRPCGRSCS